MKHFVQSVQLYLPGDLSSAGSIKDDHVQKAVRLDSLLGEDERKVLQ